MSHLSRSKPSPGQLADLDSFDLSFLIMTGNVRMKSPLGVVIDALKASGDVILWGPEAMALARVYIRGWRAYGESILEQIVDAFDLSGAISVDRDTIDALYLQYAGIASIIWADIGPAALSLIDKTSRRARAHYKRMEKQEDFGEYLEAYLAAAGERIAAGIDWYVEEELRTEVNRLIDLASTKESLRHVDRGQMIERIERLTQHPIRNFQQVADIEAGRAWHHSGIQYLNERGYRQYQIIAERDRVTCPVCQMIDGKVFSIPLAMERVDRFIDLAGDVAGITSAFRFPRVDELDNLTPSQWEGRVDLPPFHPRCRCDVVAVF